MQSSSKILRAFAVVAVLSLAAAGSAVAQQGEANVRVVAAGETIAVTMIPSGVFLRVQNDPTDAIWERVPEYQVWLEPAPAVHQSVSLWQSDSEGGMPLYFSVVSDRQSLYVRLRWQDDSRDVRTTVNEFRDAAAVQFALGNEETTYMMGSTEQPVNIWYWQLESDAAQNLAAGGPGSTSLLREQTVTAASSYQTSWGAGHKEWAIVMSRPLPASGAYQVDLETRTTAQPLAFAIWQGRKGQRDGHKKASSGWILLDLGPTQGG